MPPTDPTTLLTELTGGDRSAFEKLLPAVYDELREIAGSYLRRERRDHALQPTALVHEAWLRLVDQTRVDWRGRTHFKAVAAQAMRRALVDHARAEGRDKRGGSWRKVALDDAFTLSGAPSIDLLTLHDLLERLRELDGRQARVVELRLFGDLTNAEIAEQLDVSSRTVEREWKMGQAWLRRALSHRG